MINNEIFIDIQSEYNKQIRIHGGVLHDKNHTTVEWAEFRNKYEHRIVDAMSVNPKSTRQNERVRENLIKIATLAIAEIMAIDCSIGELIK